MTRESHRICVFVIALWAPAVSWAQAPEPSTAPTTAPQIQPFPTHPLQTVYRAFEHVGQPRMLSFSADGALLAATDVTDEVFVFDVEAGQPKWSWTYPETLQTSLGELVWPWAPAAEEAWETGQWLLRIPGTPTGWPGMTGAVFAPATRQEGREMALIHNPSLSNSHVVVKTAEDVSVKPGVWLLGGYVHLYRLPNMIRTRTIETETPGWMPLEMTIMHGLSDVTAFRYSPDGTLIATGSSEGTVALWDSATGSNLASALAEQERIGSLDFSPSGDLIATMGESGVITLWSSPRLTVQGELRGHGAGGRWIRFSPDGARLASSGWDETLRIWDVRSGKMETMVPWPRIGQEPIFIWGADGRSILFAATRQDGGVVGDINAARGMVGAAYQVDLGRITGFASPPRGDLLAAADVQGRILVWRLASPVD